MTGAHHKTDTTAPASGRQDIHRLIRRADRLGRMAMVTALIAGLSFFSNSRLIAAIGLVCMTACGGLGLASMWLRERARQRQHSMCRGR